MTGSGISMDVSKQAGGDEPTILEDSDKEPMLQSGPSADFISAIEGLSPINSAGPSQALSQSSQDIDIGEDVSLLGKLDPKEKGKAVIPRRSSRIESCESCESSQNEEPIGFDFGSNPDLGEPRSRTQEIKATSVQLWFIWPDIYCPPLPGSTTITLAEAFLFIKETIGMVRLQAGDIIMTASNAEKKLFMLKEVTTTLDKNRHHRVHVLKILPKDSGRYSFEACKPIGITEIKEINNLPKEKIQEIINSFNSWNRTALSPVRIGNLQAFLRLSFIERRKLIEIFLKERILASGKKSNKHLLKAYKEIYRSSTKKNNGYHNKEER